MSKSNKATGDKFYIPIMKTLQAEQLALRALSPEKKKKLKPILQYVTKNKKRLPEILKESSDIAFFVEFSPLPFNRDILTLKDKKEAFIELKKHHSNFIPVVTITEEETPRSIVQHTLDLLNEFNEVLIKTVIISETNKIDNYKLTCLIALHSCLPLERSHFLLDFEYVISSEPFESHLSFLADILQEARWGITATIWPPTQKQFGKMEIHYLKNWPFIYFLKKKEYFSFYSDYLTDNPLSPIIDEPKPLTIIPYFKLISLDGKRGLIIRATNKETVHVKEAAQLAVNEYGFVHEEGCSGCEDLKNIADVSTDAVGSPMSRKKLSFVHHLEVISALI